MRRGWRTHSARSRIALAARRMFESGALTGSPSSFPEAGLATVGQHEYGLAGGRVDSLYGGVIIEYKDPNGSGRIALDSNAPGTRKVIEQIRGRFTDFHRIARTDPNRLFGAGCDANTIVFVRHRGGKFEVDDPQPVTRHTVARLLRALVSLGAQGKSFTPDNLDADFGGDSETARKGIADLYRAVTTTEDPKAKTFFLQWRILFGEVCGYDLTGRQQREKVHKLGEHYGLSAASPEELLFAVQSYYALLMKFLAAEIASSFSPLGVSVLKRCHAAPTSNALRSELRSLEHGGIWSQLGVTNFVEGDLFAWYLDAWNDALDDAVRALVRKLDDYDPTTLSVEPAESRDLLKKLYHRLFPRSVRHDLGEYYTPDWLAELTLDELGYDGNPDKRLLDLACGSGTFLVMAINRAKAWFDRNRDQCGYGETELLEKILSNIIGFDLNPLAVMAARTNYLIALRDLLKNASSVELPVYLCDAIMTPSEYSGDLFAGGVEATHKLRTAGGVFQIPTEIARPRETLGKYADLIEHCLTDDYTSDQFVARCSDSGIPTEDAGLHRKLYEQLQVLHAENRNGIWARVIKNAFAPLFIDKVDFVVGNPPWVNWESLPGDYRDDTKALWKRYDLFTLSGSAARLGGGKKDLSMLFVYVAADCYLKEGGKLGYVITQTLFKTKGAGDGFRQFRYSEHGPLVFIRPLRVHDLGSMQVFDGATNCTALFIAQKETVSGVLAKLEGINYPVPYFLWSGMGRVPQEVELEDLRKQTVSHELGAIPVVPGKMNSPWLTAPADALPGIRKVIGKSDYRAYAGCCTWLNGVYWIRILDRLANGDLLIENLSSVGKIEVEPVQTVIEPDLVHPLLRGYGISMWRAETNGYIILAQDPRTRAGVKEEDMRRKLPKTYAYFKRFEEQLRQRSGFKRYFKPKDPFYSIYNVGTYSVQPIRVFWRQFLPEMRVAVYANVQGDEYLGDKVALTQHVVSCVSFDALEEAHYFAACANSSPVQVLHMNSSTSKSYGTPKVLDIIGIPRYNPKSSVHSELSALSERCHIAAAVSNVDALAALTREIDGLVAQLWGISSEELTAIRTARHEARGVPPALEDLDTDEGVEGLEQE